MGGEEIEHFSAFMVDAFITVANKKANYFFVCVQMPKVHTHICRTPVGKVLLATAQFYGSPVLAGVALTLLGRYQRWTHEGKLCF